jgi:methylated-DNA-protein-cysteine methyltransferase-like protein
MRVEPPPYGSHPPAYARIYLLVQQIPVGKVATYGQIASLAGDVTARMVGYAMAAATDDVPWHRVINAQGKISPRGDGGGAVLQQVRLEEEGVTFGPDGKIDLRRYRWYGPNPEWLVAHGFDPMPGWRGE